MVDNPENPSPIEETTSQGNEWENMANPEAEQPEKLKEEVRIKNAEQESIKEKKIRAILPDGSAFEGTVEEYHDAVEAYLDAISS